MHPPDDRSARLEEQLQLTGLSVRRRDLPAVILAWTCSNGAIARKLGPLGPVMLPITGWGHLASAALYRRHTLHTHGAAAVVRRPHTRPSIDPLALPAVALAVLGWAILIGAAAAASVWIAVTFLAIVVIDTLGDRTQRTLRDRRTRRRQHRQQHPRAADQRNTAPTSHDDAKNIVGNVIEISCVAAFPRHAGHGTGLLRQLCSILDLTTTDAVLDARTPEVADWYRHHGFTTITARRMHRPAAARAVTE